MAVAKPFSLGTPARFQLVLQSIGLPADLDDMGMV